MKNPLRNLSWPWGKAKAQTFLIGGQLFRQLPDGSYINEKTLLDTYSKSVYVYRCVETIARKVASVPFNLYQIINSKGDVKEVMNHQLLDLLYRPNPFQTRTAFMKITAINKKLAGEAFWYKARNKGGQVVELWNLRPDFVTIVTDTERLIGAYDFMKGDGTIQRFAPEDIVHIKDPNPTNILRGLSPLLAAKVRVDTENFATQYQRDFFKNSARPDFLFTTEQGLTKEDVDDMLAGWDEKHKGVGKTSRPDILHSGLKYQQISLDQRKMEFIEGLNFTRDDILVAYGIPKGMITSDDVNYANAKTAMAVFYSEVIIPELQQYTEELTEMLAVPDFDKSLYLDFDDPTPADRAQLLEEWKAGVDKWLSRNDIRYALNMAQAGDGADQLYASLVETPIGNTQVASKAMTVPRPKYNDNPERKLKIFRGRPWLKLELEMREKMSEAVIEIQKDVKDKRAATQGKKEATKIGYVSLIKAELKAGYYNLVNTVIDRRSKKFRDGLVKETNAQRERVLAKLSTEFTKSIGNAATLTSDELTKALDGARMKLAAKDILDVAAESKVFVEFSIPFLTDFVEEGGADALDLVGVPGVLNITPRLQAYLKRRAAFFADSSAGTTLEALDRTLADGIAAGEGLAGLSERVRTVYDQFPTYRADRIARTEATASTNEGALAGYTQSGVVAGKEWIATLDDRTRDSHAAINGEIVAKDDPFTNGLQYPGDEQNGDAGETINCRCVLAPAVQE